MSDGAGKCRQTAWTNNEVWNVCTELKYQYSHLQRQAIPGRARCQAGAVHLGYFDLRLCHG